MNYLQAIYLSVVALFVLVDLEKPKSDAAVGIAYAAVAKPKKVEPPKPEEKPAEPEVKPEEKCNCGDKCECNPCNCPNCPHKKELPVWKGYKTSELTYEYRKVQGEKVLEVRKYKKQVRYVKSCNKRSCTLVPNGFEWVLVK